MKNIRGVTPIVAVIIMAVLSLGAIITVTSFGVQQIKQSKQETAEMKKDIELGVAAVDRVKTVEPFADSTYRLGDTGKEFSEIHGDDINFTNATGTNIIFTSATGTNATTTGSLNVDGDLTVDGLTTLNSIAYTWPGSDGSANQVLHTDGSGGLSWAADDSGAGGTGSNFVFNINQTALSPSTTVGLFVQASTTIDADLRVSSHFNVGTTTPWDGYGMRVATTSVFTENITLFEQTTDPSIDFLTPQDQWSFYIDNDGGDVFNLWNDSNLATWSTSNATSGITFHAPEICIANSCRTSWPTGGGASAWELLFAGAITPTSTSNGIFVKASSTIDSDLRVSGHFNVATTSPWDGYGVVVATSTLFGGSGDIKLGSGSNMILASSTVYTDQNLRVDGTTTLNGIAYTWPAADGSNGQVLHTNGAGTLSWAADDTGGGGGSAAWEAHSLANTITPTTTNANIFVSGNATTTGHIDVDDTFYVQDATAGVLQVSANPNAGVFEIESSESINPLSNLDSATSWQAVIQRSNDSAGTAAGIGFAVTSGADPVGAGIAHIRDGSNSFGSLNFYTRPDGNDDTITNRLQITASGNIVLQGGDFDASTGLADFGDGSLEIPNGTAPTVNAIGEIAYDSTDKQVVIATSTSPSVGVIPVIQKLWAATVASTSVDFVSGGVIPMPRHRDAVTITEIYCHVESGTSVVINISDGTNDTETVTCSTSGAEDTDVTSNPGFTAGETPELQVGTITGSVDYLSFSVWGFITRE